MQLAHDAIGGSVYLAVHLVLHLLSWLNPAFFWGGCPCCEITELSCDCDDLPSLSFETVNISNCSCADSEGPDIVPCSSDGWLGGTHSICTLGGGIDGLAANFDLCKVLSSDSKTCEDCPDSWDGDSAGIKEDVDIPILFTVATRGGFLANPTSVVQDTFELSPINVEYTLSYDNANVNCDGGNSWSVQLQITE